MGKEGIRTTKTIIETTTTLTAKRRVAVRNEVARDREVYPALGLSHLKKKGAEAILIVAVGVAAAVLSLPFLLLAAAAGGRERDDDYKKKSSRGRSYSRSRSPSPPPQKGRGGFRSSPRDVKD